MRKTAAALGALFLAAGMVFANEPGVFYTNGPRDGKAIALTFDDGPGPWTERILAVLKENNVKATFFMEGDVLEFRQHIGREVKDGGHEIGSHLYSHLNFYQYEKNHTDFREKMIEEIDKTAMIIEKATGERPRLLRMPNGFSKRWARDTAREKGYVMVNWTFGADWSKMSAIEMTEAYKKALTPGAILLMHDGGKNRSRTLETLGALIAEARQQGYEMVTVSELLGLKGEMVVQTERPKKIRIKQRESGE